MTPVTPRGSVSVRWTRTIRATCYLDEFAFRFNRRSSHSRGKLFYRLLQQAIAIEPTPYKDLIKHVKSGPEHKR